MLTLRWAYLLTAFACGALLMGCQTPTRSESNDSATLQGKLVITGSSTVAPLVAEIAKRFERDHEGVRIDVQTGGSGKGIADVRLGVADIGMASRGLKAEERDLRAIRIAADGVALIVHSSNPVEELTSSQILDLYQGRISNWSEIDDWQEEVIVVHKAEGRATLEVFLDYFQLDNTTVKADVIVGDNQHGIKTVAANPGAVGYVSIGAAEAEIATGTTIRILPLAGQPADSAHVASGEYPLNRPLNLVIGEETSPLAEAFLQYCGSESVDDLIKSQHFVPVARP